MRLATTVKLPKEYKPRFPDRCVVCYEHPDSTAKIAHSYHNLLVELFFPFIGFFGWSRVEFPICQRCKWRFRLQRWGRELTGWLLMILATCLIAPHFADWPKGTRRFVVIGLVILVVLPHFAVDALWARYFTTTAGKDSIDYEFASLPYGLEFLALNDEHAIC